jgi:hypothetical protein
MERTDAAPLVYRGAALGMENPGYRVWLGSLLLNRTATSRCSI